MPFDLVTRSDKRRSNAQEILERAALASGIATLDPRILDAHKTDQLRRHPPSWLHRHSTAVQLGQPLLLIAGVIGFSLLGANGHTIAAVTCLVLVCPLAIIPLLIPTRGLARWQESWNPDPRIVHPEVRDAALRLKLNLPAPRRTLSGAHTPRPLSRRGISRRSNPARHLGGREADPLRLSADCLLVRGARGQVVSSC